MRPFRTFSGRTTLCTLLLASASATPVAAFELPCAREDSLSETAAELLLSGEALRGDTLLPKAKALGFDGVALQAHDGLDDAALIAWLKLQAERADAPLVCGEASSESRRLVLVSARGGRLSFSKGKVSGKLSPGFRAPHLVVEDREGRAERIDVKVAQLAEGVALPPERPWARIQLVAEGPAGPRPVAELRATSDEVQAVPSVAAGPAPEPGDAAARERSQESLFSRIGAFRRREGVSGVRPNQLLSASAQRHAARVCELGKVAHRLREGEDPETRLREEHIEARSVGEAVARANSADAALSAIFESPSHRLAVAEKAFTDAGIGQAYDAKGHTCVVVLLAAWPRRIP